MMYDHACSMAIEKVRTDLRTANPLWEITSAAVLSHFQGWSHHDRSCARSTQCKTRESCSWAQPFLCGRWYYQSLDALRFDWRSLPPTTSMLTVDPWQDTSRAIFRHHANWGLFCRLRKNQERKPLKACVQGPVLTYHCKLINANKLFSQLTISCIGSIVIWYF